MHLIITDDLERMIEEVDIHHLPGGIKEKQKKLQFIQLALRPSIKSQTF
jgi:hypothetical protein